MNDRRRALVLRPEPGNARTVARLRAAGVEAVALPLFEVRPLAWEVSAADAFDALLLTSANAVRFAGAGLDRLSHLPVVAVGEATAVVAREAGMRVAVTGQGDAAAAVAAARDFPRLLHLAGREYVAIPGITRVIVYASEPVTLASGALVQAVGKVVLLHSARAAARFAALAADLPRGSITLAAISAKVAAAAGGGWERIVVADAPNDAALVTAATMLAIDRTRGRGDNADHE